MSKQLAVNDAVEGIVAQGGWSVNYGTIGRYRGSGGCKCAIGHLIPDEKYSSDIECDAADSEAVKNCVSKKYGNLDASFLINMQKDLHDALYDDPFEIKSYTKAVAAFCEKHSLELPPILREQGA